MICGNQQCGAENVKGSTFCQICGARLVPGKPWYLIVSATCVLLILLGLSIHGIVLGERAEQQQLQRKQQKQLELQRAFEARKRAFEASPAGKKAKADREAAERKAAVGRFARLRMAASLEEGFLNRGFDVRCTADEDRGTLYIIGPPVDRVFVHQFIRTKSMVDALRVAGFVTVTFRNTKSGFSDEYLDEAYDLKR
jgi:zinc-ribbon domain